ncbi:hypothetical protein Ciccas_000200 [Cichlidogyrus casuarinus]|uniref:Uncharacterized protein n=1 Tax=Cichlidogyrus casuarinus TaxID=1844966 RepID=A0ABD2QNU8_9PLAT
MHKKTKSQQENFKDNGDQIFIDGPNIVCLNRSGFSFFRKPKDENVCIKRTKQWKEIQVESSPRNILMKIIPAQVKLSYQVVDESSFTPNYVSSLEISHNPKAHAREQITTITNNTFGRTRDIEDKTEELLAPANSCNFEPDNTFNILDESLSETEKLTTITPANNNASAQKKAQAMVLNMMIDNLKKTETRDSATQTEPKKKNVNKTLPKVAF